MTIAEARVFAGRQIGLPASFDGSVASYRELTPSQQIALTQAVFAYIKANPGQFTAAQNQTVAVEWSRVERLDDSDASGWEVFGNAILDEALRVGGSVASIGDGVATSVRLAGLLIPLVFIGALVLFALPYVKKANA